MSAIDLVVLGLIKQQPQGAYDIQKELAYRNISSCIKVSIPSIYKKVIQLEEKGYIESDITKTGKMPEKAVYSLTDKGEEYFLYLMKKISAQTVNIFLDLNSVIMNLDLVSIETKEQCLSQIKDNIIALKEQIVENITLKSHIPQTGKGILSQQLALTETLELWATEFSKEEG
ncbi:DNA-binding PadR family transcriptional regulator [Fontibacillus solani]|uniref:DNA-binding PadR family transcriptional regulator n=1 Tax=Fontibacillus solani TaxID=1572857 RepID=A0A7W3SRU3_9BACL|nr:PadR family transcriptional regulator [Fontibacillus solani]MBA9084909.1 DNA-binding PadR family transcriptional regulator [Fontibacillus solani]